MFYLTTHSTHFIYGYMASDIWLRTILIGYYYRLTARVLLYAPSHRQDNTYHDLCYTSRGALAGTRNSSMGPPHRTMSERSTSELRPAPVNVPSASSYNTCPSFKPSKLEPVPRCEPGTNQLYERIHAVKEMWLVVKVTYH